MTNRSLPFLALPVIALLGGCSAISALNSAAKPLDAYELRGNQPPEIVSRRSNLHVIIEPPVVGGALDTDRILIRPTRLQAQYLPDGRWTDKPADMLRTTMVREIDATGAFRYVGRTPLGAGGDYAVLTEITDFQAELTPPDDIAGTHLRVSAKIVREADLQIVAQRVFETRSPAASTETDDLVTSLDRGLSDIVGQITVWVVGAL